VKLVSPPPEFNPPPVKRKKFRNMLTRNGGLLGSEQVEVILSNIEKGETPENAIGELLTFGREEGMQNGNVELLTFEESENGETGQPGDLLIDTDSIDTTEIPPSSTHTDLASISFPSPTFTPFPTPSTHQAISNLISMAQKSTDVSSNISADTSLLDIDKHTAISDLASLVDLVTPQETPSGAFGDLAGLAMSCELVTALDGLDFQPLIPIQDESRENPFDSLAANMNDFNISSLNNAFSTPDEVVFKGRKSRKSSADVDPVIADRAFRMFSIGVKSQDA
jgi:hypothetical protein